MVGRKIQRMVTWCICTALSLFVLNVINIHIQSKTVILSDKISNNYDQGKMKDSKRDINDDSANEYDMKDDIVDAMLINLTKAKLFPAAYQAMSLHDLARSLGSPIRRSAKKPTYFTNRTSGPEDPSWKKFNFNIRQFSLYDPDDPAVDEVMHDLATLPIVKADIFKHGSELKLLAHLENGGKAIMKPMRYDREVEENPNHFIFDEFERHIAEIAAFHLDRCLGFFRVPPAIGRKINITSELIPLFPKTVNKTVFVSPAGNTCFFGECYMYCDSGHAFCGHPDTIEVSMMAFLPETVARSSLRQPYRTRYNLHPKPYWEMYDDLCDKLKKQHPYNNGKLLIDIIEAHMFDFLTGNNDRHNFEFFEEFNYFSFPITIDNGRGFGRKKFDTFSILAPLRQCCMIRKSTLLKYVKIYQGPDKLSDLMEKAMANDPVAPVLLRGHLTALDRRLLKILRTVAQCLETNEISDIVVDDGF